jgi:hypothetical protein
MSVKDKRAPKKVLKGYTEGRRLVGRPRGRWIDAVNKDVKQHVKMQELETVGRGWRCLDAD